MRLLDRYMSIEFLKILFLSILAFTSMSLMVDIIDRIDNFVDKQAQFLDVFRFYIYQIPHYSILSLPGASLLASILTISQFNRYNEITAMRASGLNPHRILLPLIMLGFSISLAAVAVNELVIPTANTKKYAILEENIKKKQRSIDTTRTTFNYQGENGRTYSIGSFNPDTKELTNVDIQLKKNNQLIYRLSAEKGKWNGLQWILQDGYLRYFSISGEAYSYHFKELIQPGFIEKPSDFLEEQKDPREMNYLELREYITKKQKEGETARDNQVELFMKLSVPFANLVIIIFGISLTFTAKKGSAAVGFGLSLLICIIFWGFLHLGKVIGRSGIIHPMLSTWLANITFGTIGLTLFAKLHRG